MKLRYLLFVLLAACLPLFVAVLVTANAVPPAETAIEGRLTAATGSVQARLEADAARRQQHLLRLTTLKGITEPLVDAAAQKRVPSPESAGQVRSAFIELIGRDVPELFVVATAQGAQVVVTEGEPQELPVSEVPLAAAALNGQIAGAFGLFDGSLFRFYAMPVGVGEAAVVVGDRVGNATANRLRDHAKVDHVSFVLRNELVPASSLPKEERSVVLPAATNAGRSTQAGHLGTGLSLPEGLNAFLPVFSLIDPFFPFFAPPSLTRSLAVELDGDIAMVVTFSTRSALGWLGRLQFLACLASFGVFVFGLLWMSFVFRPVTRQARSIEAQLSRLQVDRTARLGLKGFSAPFIGVAEQVDALASHVESGTVPVAPAPKEHIETTRPPKPLDLPLQSAPLGGGFDAPEATGGDFPFGETFARTGTDPEPPAPSFAPVLPSPPPVQTFRAEEPVARFADRVVPQQIIESAASVSGPVPLPAPSRRASPDVPPPPPSAPAKKHDPFAAFGPPPEPDMDDRTREARIPEELLALSRELEQELLDPPDEADEDDAHFREVFKDYCEVRQSTGEGTAGLTVDKFVAQLHKNREKLVERFNCRTIRFQVHVKDGKAAIKAAPVR